MRDLLRAEWLAFRAAMRATIPEGDRALVRSSIAAAIRPNVQVRVRRDATFQILIVLTFLVPPLGALAVPYWTLSARSPGSGALGSYASGILVAAAGMVLVYVTLYFSEYLLDLGPALQRWRDSLSRRRSFPGKDGLLRWIERWAGRLGPASNATVREVVAFFIGLGPLTLVAYWVNRSSSLSYHWHVLAVSIYSIGGAVLGLAWLSLVADWYVSVVTVRKMKRRLCESQFTYELMDLVADAPNMSNADPLASRIGRHDYVRALEASSSSLERHWPRLYHTGCVHADEATAAWVRQVAAAFYAEQRPVAIRLQQPSDRCDRLMKLLVAFLRRDEKAFKRFQVAESSETHAGWRRFAKGLLIALIVLVGVALAIVGVGQPGLANQLASWQWPEFIADSVRLGTGIQPQVLAVSAAFFTLATRLATPQGAVGRSGRGIGGRLSR